MARKPKKHEHVNHERWLVSYADFITLLFAFFVVMFAVSQVDAKKMGRFVESVNTAFQFSGVFSPSSNSGLGHGAGGNSVVSAVVGQRPGFLAHERPQAEAAGSVQRIRQRLEQGGLLRYVSIHDESDGLTLSIPLAFCFGQGGAELVASSLGCLRTIAEALAGEPGSIEVLSYEDDRPGSETRYTSDWELTAVRAARIARALQDCGIGPERLLACGLAGAHPAVDNSSELNREANRRIEIRWMAEGS